MGASNRYSFVDVAGTVYAINNSSVFCSDVSIELDNDYISKGFTDGAVNLGNQRQKERKATFSVNIDYSTEAAFRTAVNALIYNFRKAVKIRDTQLNIECDIIPENYKIKYDQGGLNLGAVCDLSLIITTPYWYDVTETSITNNNVATQSYTIINSGSTPIYCKLIITAIGAMTAIKAIVSETGNGIEIIRTFIAGEIITIDNKLGICNLYDTSIKNLITTGSGFFEIPVGTYTLVVTSTTANFNITMSYKKGYYV